MIQTRSRRTLEPHGLLTAAFPYSYLLLSFPLSLQIFDFLLQPMFSVKHVTLCRSTEVPPASLLLLLTGQSRPP